MYILYYIYIYFFTLYVYMCIYILYYTEAEAQVVRGSGCDLALARQILAELDGDVDAGDISRIYPLYTLHIPPTYPVYTLHITCM